MSSLINTVIAGASIQNPGAAEAGQEYLQVFALILAPVIHGVGLWMFFTADPKKWDKQTFHGLVLILLAVNMHLAMLYFTG